MNFGLQRSNQVELPGSEIELRAAAAPLTEADFTSFNIPEGGTPASRIAKRQIRCRKCFREVASTEQTGLQCGRRIIVCRFYCHGDTGEIRICEDQLTEEMIFDVFDGDIALRERRQPEKPAAIPDNAGAVVDIEAEVIPVRALSESSQSTSEPTRD